jgi:hypothetical protein
MDLLPILPTVSLPSKLVPPVTGRMRIIEEEKTAY